MPCVRTLIHARSALWIAPQNLQFTLWNSDYGRNAYVRMAKSIASYCSLVPRSSSNSQTHFKFLLRKRSLLTPESLSYAAKHHVFYCWVNSNNCNFFKWIFIERNRIADVIMVKSWYGWIWQIGSWQRWKNYEKKENQVYMFFTCFNMFLYSVNSEFYG